jgi:acyl-CoA reductase-like NAD-dependent aldehyde dehydrogenase
VTSRFLSSSQLAGLVKVGDALVPGDAELPSFSRSGAAAHADRVLASLAEPDRRGLTVVLGVLRFLPAPLLRGLLVLIGRLRGVPGAAGAPFRMLDVGLRGIVMSLYWSDLGDAPSVHDAIGWDARVVDRAEDVATATRPPMLPPIPPPDASASAARQAMAAARAGQASLRALDPRARARLLGRLREVVLRRREEIVGRIQQDTGKTRSDALVSEVYGVLENLAWLEKRGPKHLRPRKVHTPLALMGKTSWLWFEPLGTLLVIAPWNYPFYQALVPIAFAVLAGDTVVHKPSEWTPLTGLIEDLLAEAGFAPNWVRVVYGDGRVGAELIAERPDKIFFTGSTRTGRAVLAAAAPLLVPVELELGGKDAMIVFADANVDRAAAGAVWGAFTCTGQSCTSVERLYVEAPAYEAMKAALVRETRRILQRVDTDGDGDVGAMTTDFQVKIVARHVADARAKGAAFLTGEDWDGESKLIPPMVVDQVTDDMLVVTEETFGPLLPIVPFRTEAEAVRLANRSEYGLTASVWTADRRRAARVAGALQVGGVSINNVMLTEGNPALPFGGTKQSGFGRYKGEHGLAAFSNVKSVLVDKNSAKIEANWYPYTAEKYRLFTDLMTSLFGSGLAARLRFPLAGLRLERYAGKAGKEGRPGGT